MNDVASCDRALGSEHSDVHGKRYCNSYAWFMEMYDGKAIEVTDFLDLSAFDALIAGTPSLS